MVSLCVQGGMRAVKTKSLHNEQTQTGVRCCTLMRRNYWYCSEQSQIHSEYDHTQIFVLLPISILSVMAPLWEQNVLCMLVRGAVTLFLHTAQAH